MKVLLNSTTTVLHYNSQTKKDLPCVPLAFQNGLTLDALVVICAFVIAVAEN